MAYRFTGIARQANTDSLGATDGRAFMAPAFTWKPDADTTFTVLTEHLRTRLPSDPTCRGAPATVIGTLVHRW